jgi:hypothetical protein
MAKAKARLESPLSKRMQEIAAALRSNPAREAYDTILKLGDNVDGFRLLAECFDNYDRLVKEMEDRVAKAVQELEEANAARVRDLEAYCTTLEGMQREFKARLTAK